MPLWTEPKIDIKKSRPQYSVVSTDEALTGRNNIVALTIMTI